MKNLWNNWERKGWWLVGGAVIPAMAWNIAEIPFSGLLGSAMFAAGMYCWGAAHVEATPWAKADDFERGFHAGWAAAEPINVQWSRD